MRSEFHLGPRDDAMQHRGYFFFLLSLPSPGGSYFSFHILEAQHG